MKHSTQTVNGIEFTRINNDINGNPRYVCGFLNLINDRDKAKTSANIYQLDNLYSIAVKRANTIGGRKYHNKQYGGGIVFQSYNIEDLAARIKELSK